MSKGHEDRSPQGRGPQHCTHYDDCGCQSANYEKRLAAQKEAVASLEERIATLEADYQTARTAVEVEAALVREARERVATLEAEREIRFRDLMESRVSNATLRDALEKMCAQFFAGDDSICHAGICHRNRCHRCSAIDAGTNALASTPAQSLAAHDAEVLERAAKRFLALCPCEHPLSPEECETCHWFATGAHAIRALAAQAQEVKP